MIDRETPVARAAAAGRIPDLPGPSIQLDFSRPIVEQWRAEDAFEVVRKTVPRRTTSGEEWPADADMWDMALAVNLSADEVPATEFRISFNDNGLFMRACSRFQREHEPDTTLRDHGQIRWGEDDLLEIRLRAPADDHHRTLHPLYHFVLSAGGTRYEARDENPAFAPEWTAHVEHDALMWTAWIHIPFAAMDIAHPPAELEINLGRCGPHMPARSWGPEWRQTRERIILFEGIDRIQTDHTDGAGDENQTESLAGIRVGEGIALNWASGVARVQDRWIEGHIIFSETLLRDGDVVEASLWEPGGRTPLDAVRSAVERPSARMRVDLRRWGLAAARIEANLVRNGEVIGHAAALLKAHPLPAACKDGFRIPLLVNIPAGPDAGARWPLYIGVPFPAGQIWQTRGWTVEDASGNRYPTQLEAVGFWAHQGSIRWMRVDTVANPHAELYLAYRPGIPAPSPVNPVTVERDGNRVVLSNGLADYVLGTEGSPIRAIRRDGSPVADTSRTRGLYLVDQRGRLAVAKDSDAEVRIESAGPVAASVRIEGDYTTDTGEPVARHITRVELTADSASARVTHTLVLTRDTADIWFQEAGWEFDVAAGADPEATFALERQDPDRCESVRLPNPGDEVYLLQESHFRFSGGENVSRFVHNGETLSVGERIGDWFMLQNDNAGLAISCRESARQHPKEFAAAGNRRMTLKLFSPRTGEQLDFRSEVLVERWNLQALAEGRRTPEQAAEFVEEVKAIPSNALGWSKTHEILFSPAVRRRAPATVAPAAWWHSHPVFAITDPSWLYQSEAMGILHPRDPQRFPEVETRIQSVIENFYKRAETQGMRGFIDYEAGPPFRYGGHFFRWGLTYTLRADAWRVFARSGDRTAFNFATKSNRSWGDNYLASWGDEHKTKGLYTQCARGTEAFNLPFYWGDHTFVNIRSSTNLKQLIWDYYLTGYRRAADQVEDFARGLTTNLMSASGSGRDRRIIMTFRTVLQCYGFTWDPALEEMAHILADRFEDRDGAVGLTKNRPLASSTYKTVMDVRALIEAWELFGHPRYRRMADRLGRYLVRVEMGTHPISYTNPLGLIGADLWRRTRDPALAQLLLLHMRWANAAIEQSIGSPHAVSFLLEGAPAIQDVVVRTNVDRRPTAAWAGASHYDGEIAFFFTKADRDAVRLHLKTPSGIDRENPRIEALNPGRGIDLVRGGFKQSNYTEWTAPLDAPEGIFRVTPPPTSESANHLGILSRPEAMVLYAPGYWIPFPPQLPAPKWYFRVPEGARNAAIFFEGPATLYAPDGQVRHESGPVSEWVELPAASDGLWSFSVHDAGAVRVRNVPPFFAAESPDSWFDPGIDWCADGNDVPEFEIPQQSAFVSGLPAFPENRAYFVSRDDALTLDPSFETTDSDRGMLPFRKGTIEFWMRPNWGSFMLDGDTVTLFSMPARGRRWDFEFHRQIVHHTHALHAYAIGENEHGSERSFRSYREHTLLEPGEWVHIALTWGQGAGTRDGMQDELTFGIYVNGQAGKQIHFAGNRDRHPAHQPLRLVFPGLNAAIAQLRVSDIIRYRGDFNPPVFGPDDAQDEHTRFWFPLDDTLEGRAGHAAVRLVRTSL